MKTEQRVIKFQSIHRHFKTGEICFHEWGPGECGEFKAPAYIHGYSQIGNRQFTGLVDKEGNEIYEGDIVNIQYNHFGNKEVVWENKEGRWNIGRFNLSKCKKVGNIYQSPHLLPSTTTI